MEMKYLIDQLEAELAAQHREVLIAQAAELAEGEIAGITLLQRLHSALGKEISLRSLANQPLTGTLLQVGNGWVLLRTQLGEELVNLTNVVEVSGLAGSNTQIGKLEMRSPMTQILRRMARARTQVIITLENGEKQSGFLIAVYKDHLELGVPGRVNATLAVVINSVFSVRASL